MYFEVAGITVNPLIPPLVAFLISVFTSTGGVSGAFIILPFQVSVLGFTSPSVSATNQLYNVVAIPSGVYRYIREGRMIWPLTWIVIAGTLPGVLIGAFVRINYLTNPTYFKIFAGFVLLYIGFRILRENLSKKKPHTLEAEQKFNEIVKGHKTEKGKIKLPKAKVLQFNFKILEYEFVGERFKVKTVPIFIISSIVGIVGGIYGIGGGAIMAPIYVTFFNLPVYTVAGPALMGTFITSVFGVIIFEILAPFYPTLSVAPDWKLGILFGIGGFLGMYVGARLQKYLPAKIIKLILSVAILFLGIRYILNFVWK
ncbi:MAG: sulfite exporter TauE/SafE family protein [Ignavibacteria bacterium]|nr:sulfite exporter TauE/SafE family protein [Ignavibacteria bacterium]